MTLQQSKRVEDSKQDSLFQLQQKLTKISEL
jgi:hypothetical protein